MSDIRVISAYEVPLLLNGAREFHKEAGFGGGLNEPHIMDSLARYIDSGVGTVMVAGDVPFRGAIGGVLVPDFITGDMTCFELFWFVRESERGVIGARLLRAFEHEVHRRGAKRIWMICMVGPNAEQVSKFYERSGYKHKEHMFLKEF